MSESAARLELRSRPPGGGGVPGARGSGSARQVTVPAPEGVASAGAEEACTACDVAALGPGGGGDATTGRAAGSGRPATAGRAGRDPAALNERDDLRNVCQGHRLGGCCRRRGDNSAVSTSLWPNSLASLSAVSPVLLFVLVAAPEANRNRQK